MIAAHRLRLLHQRELLMPVLQQILTLARGFGRLDPTVQVMAQQRERLGQFVPANRLVRRNKFD